MNYSTIRKFDIANGEGIRASLFVSGCRHHCKGCFSKQTWDFSSGSEFTDDVENELLSYCDNAFISGLSILGGDPFEPENQPGILRLLKRFRDRFPEKNVWIYTGCTLEELKTDGCTYRTKYTDEILSLTDVIVDGPFVEGKKDITLKFRGSSNQRIIYLKDSGLVDSKFANELRKRT